jgi:alpha-beta hydrolase superfamily lysophospholipase
MATMDILLWLLFALMFLVVLYYSIGMYAALTLTKIGEHPQYSNDPSTYGCLFETVFFKSREDQLRIAAWYIPQSKSAKAVILVHGRNASKQNAISGNMPKLAAELHKAGFSVLVLDLRGHGESEGKRYTWGVRERWDVLGAVDFLLDQGISSGEIGVLGISLGGAAVIGAAAETQAIGVVIVESTFSDLSALVIPNWKKESGLPLFLLPGVYFMWNRMYHFNLRNVAPYQEIVKIEPRPVLILHCKCDDMVPVSHAYQLKEAYPEAELVLFENCSHAEIFRDRPEEYLRVLLSFLMDQWK